MLIAGNCYGWAEPLQKQGRGLDPVKLADLRRTPSPIPRCSIHDRFKKVIVLWFSCVTCCYVRTTMVSNNMVT